MMRASLVRTPLLLAAALALALPVSAKVTSGRVAMGEVWILPSMFNQALAPLAPLPRRAVTEGMCPGLALDADKVLHNYDFDAKMKTRGTGENKRWEVVELKNLTPSGCVALDSEVERLMRTAIPQFAEPRQDLDDNGWTRIPRIKLQVTD
jgi:hypothetical protein